MEWLSNMLKVIEAEPGLKLRQSGARALYLPPTLPLLVIPLNSQREETPLGLFIKTTQ